MAEIIVGNIQNGQRVVVSGEEFPIPLVIDVIRSAVGEGMLSITSVENGKDLLVVPKGGSSDETHRGIREVRLLVRPEE